MMFTPLLALTFAAIAPLVSAYPITGDGVNCRSGPGTSHSIVKSYKKGLDVAITCQTDGTDVNGNNIWDKTADGCYIADYYIKTGSSSYVTKKCDGSGSGGGSSGTLPGLTATQSKHAKAIIKEAKSESLGRQGCLAGIATALVEVSFNQHGLGLGAGYELTPYSPTSTSTPTRKSPHLSSTHTTRLDRTTIALVFSSSVLPTTPILRPIWMLPSLLGNSSPK